MAAITTTTITSNHHPIRTAVVPSSNSSRAQLDFRYRSFLHEQTRTSVVPKGEVLSETKAAMTENSNIPVTIFF
jgi:hypothetical protein